ncbi:MEI2-like 3 [Forsythia ovata]|uniref:MEI2-like 3 n=1 Tax=Forsythia ovata TaxID=205694 RepID=A0ABD1QD75_9LAMI
MNPNELDNGYQSVDIACLSLNKFHPDAEGNLSLNEDEDRATGSFLPLDEDELLDGFDLSWLPKLVDDSEEYDVFGSGGGLELESELSHENLSIGILKVSLYDGVVGNKVARCSLPNGVGTISVEHPLREHPS